MNPYIVKITLHHKHRGDWYYITSSDANPPHGPDDPGRCLVSLESFVSDVYDEESGGPFAGDDPRLSPDFQLRMEESSPVLISTADVCFNGTQHVRSADPVEISLGLLSKHMFTLKGERFTIETLLD